MSRHVNTTEPSANVMTSATIPAHLFVPPRLAEEQKPFWNPLIPQSVEGAMGGLSGLGTLGEITPISTGNTTVDAFQGVLAQAHNAFIDLIGAVTGSNAQAQAQSSALQLAQINARAQVQSAMFWSSAAPWLALAGLGAVAVVAYAVVKK